MAHILDKDLFKAHCLHHVFTDNDWLVVFWGDLVVCVLEQALGKQIVFKTFIVVVHGKDLLLLTDALVPAATTSSTASPCNRRVCSE